MDIHSDCQLPQSETLSELINEGVDEFKKDRGLIESKVAQDEEQQKAKQSILRSYWFKVLLAICLVNLGISLSYYRDDLSTTLSTEEAELELEQVLGEDYPLVLELLNQAG